MTVKALYDFLNKKIPTSLSCEWDNDGLMCCPRPEREVKKVLLTLDISAEAVDRAIDGGFDAVISHHPLVFKPIKSLNTDDCVQRRLIKLVENGISAMSFHTRLDALDGGVNDMLAHILGLTDVEKFGQNGEDIGRIGTVPTTTAREFAEKVKKALGTIVVLYSGDRPVKRVAVLGGHGEDFVWAAKMAGADSYVSGRIGYHNMTDANDLGINLFEAGHFYTENPVLPILAYFINEFDESIEVEFEKINPIKAV